jgi:CheY-like chemotaxis protein
VSKKAKILLVDNDVDIVDLNKAVLKNNNYEVVEAFSGSEGLEKAKTEKPDLIVLDLMMEKHDSGFTFAKTLKADPEFKNIPVLMLTSVADATGFEFSQRKDGYWMKTDNYLKKPVTPDRLLEEINKLLEIVKHENK